MMGIWSSNGQEHLLLRLTENEMTASSFGCGDKIASITTIAMPRHGSKTIDQLFLLPRPLWNLAAFAVNNWIRM